MILVLISYLLRGYELVILIRVIISWISVDTYHPVVQWIYRVTEPALEPIRRLIPMERIGLDISPIIVMLLIELLQRMIFRIL